MSSFTLRVIWPVEDPRLFDGEAVALARADLPEVARRTGAVITGRPVFRVVDCADLDWPATATAVWCDVPAERVAGRAPAGRGSPRGREVTAA